MVRINKKKPGVTKFQPMSILSLQFQAQENAGMLTPRSLELNSVPSTLNTDITKVAVLLFINEVVYKTLHDDYQNEALFDFLQHSMQMLDAVEHCENFHLVFLVQLSSLYGFYPSHLSEGSYFDLMAGQFCDGTENHPYYIEPPQTEMFRKLIACNYESLALLHFEHSTRKNLLHKLIDYFRIHLDGLKEIKSVKVLESVFDEVR